MPEILIDATRDYYGILGVLPNASAAEIKDAWKKRSVKFHPDRPAGNEEKFKEVQEAREVLEDPDNRAFYDRVRREYQTASSWSWTEEAVPRSRPSDYRQTPQQPGPRGKRGFFDSFPYRDLRKFIVKSLVFFSEDLEIIFPDGVNSDFRTAANYVFAIWREIQPELEPQEDDTIVEYGGLEIAIPNFDNFDL